jgi:hypothetical protein
MSFSQKTGLASKTGPVILGAALISSLMLTACGTSSPTGPDSNSQPSASATASAAPTGITEFKSDAFDLSKQVSLDIPASDKNILLSDGAVTQTEANGKDRTFSYIPYENKDSAWKYTPEIPVGSNPSIKLMRWKDKSYLVIDGWDNISQPASGLQAEKKTTAHNVIVLDAATGKTVNVFKGEPSEVGANTQDKLSFNPRTSNGSTSDNTYIPFLTGLTYRSLNGDAKLVDPITGKTIATENRVSGPMSLNNESGFYKDELNERSKTTTKAVFGNFGFVVNDNPVANKAETGHSYQNSIFALVNTVTNETISKMECKGTGDIENQDVVYSPDFRYVVFAKQYAFDTKTGKSFCSSPTGKEDARDFQISAVDNSGLLYGNAGRDYLRVSIADNTKVETLVSNATNDTKFPIFITKNGSAVFHSEKSKDVLVVVPSKTPTVD